MFYIHPMLNNWSPVTEKIISSSATVSYTTKELFYAQFGNSLTNTIPRVTCKVSDEILKNKKASWERKIDWLVGDLAFNNYPIYLIEIKNIEDFNTIFGKIECYINQFPTILYPFKLSTKLLSPTVEDINKYLSDTKQAQWVRIKQVSCYYN